MKLSSRLRELTIGDESHHLLMLLSFWSSVMLDRLNDCAKSACLLHVVKLVTLTILNVKSTQAITFADNINRG